MVVEPAESGRARSGRGVQRLTALEPVANRPIVHHVLDGLEQAEVDQLIITGDADALIDLRDSIQRYGPRFDAIEYAPSRVGGGLKGTLDTVAPLVGDAPCLMHPADGLLDPPVLTASGLLDGAGPGMVVFASRGVDGGSPGRGSHHRRLAGGAGAGEGAGLRADVALFGPGMLMRAQMACCEGTADLGGAVARMSALGLPVRVQAVDGWRRYRGDGHDLLELNRVALDRLSGMAMTPASALECNRIEGRVHMHPTADVRDSVIIGPTVIGAGAMINEAYIGPYTSVGTGARIEGAEVERSIVADGACVIHVGSRLVSSLVGRNARIFREFSLPRALRLWVGDGDEVALC